MSLIPSANAARLRHAALRAERRELGIRESLPIAWMVLGLASALNAVSTILSLAGL